MSIFRIFLKLIINFFRTLEKFQDCQKKRNGLAQQKPLNTDLSRIQPVEVMVHIPNI